MLDAHAARTLAVPDFNAPIASDTSAPAARGLALVMMTDLARVPGGTSWSAAARRAAGRD